MAVTACGASAPAVAARASSRRQRAIAAGTVATAASTGVEAGCIFASRSLAVDAGNKANGGHTAAPLGQAPSGYALLAEEMNFNPANPQRVNRDRLFLSSGHGFVYQYCVVGLAGYESVTVDDIEQFRQRGSNTPGHPEIFETDGIGVTTGLLGTGVSNAVGLAAAEARRAAVHYRPGMPRIDHYTYCNMSGGGCQEGISIESWAHAVHLGLVKLIALHGDIGITTDGHTDISLTEWMVKLYEAYGGQVLTVSDGDGDVDFILKTVAEGKARTDKPTSIKVKTALDFAFSDKADSHDAQGVHLSADEAIATREQLGNKRGEVDGPQNVYDGIRVRAADGAKKEVERSASWAEYHEAEPVLAAQVNRVAVDKKLPDGWEDCLPKLVLLAGTCSEPLGGVADLAPSSMVRVKCTGDFLKCFYEGRNMRSGTLNFSTGAVCNDVSLHKIGLAPYCASFTIFGEGMRNVTRLAVLAQLGAAPVTTHDSIVVDVDVPTHRPIDTLPSLRTIPPLTDIRLGGGNATSGTCNMAFELSKYESMLSFRALSHQAVATLPYSSVANVGKGTYSAIDEESLELNLTGTGSKVGLSVGAAKEMGREVRVELMPSWELFRGHRESYRNALLLQDAPGAGVEAAVSRVWGDSADGVVGTDRLGAAAPCGTRGANWTERHWATTTLWCRPKVSPSLVAEAWRDLPSRSRCTRAGSENLGLRAGRLWLLRSAAPPSSAGEDAPWVNVESAVNMEWGEFADAFFGLDRFGAAAPGGTCADRFGFNVSNVVVGAERCSGMPLQDGLTVSALGDSLGGELDACGCRDSEPARARGARWTEMHGATTRWWCRPTALQSLTAGAWRDLFSRCRCRRAGSDNVGIRAGTLSVRGSAAPPSLAAGARRAFSSQNVGLQIGRPLAGSGEGSGLRAYAPYWWGLSLRCLAPGQAKVGETLGLADSLGVGPRNAGRPSSTTWLTLSTESSGVETGQERLSVMVSATIVDNSGCTLSGRTIQAFLVSIKHAMAFTVGLNCVLGAAQLKKFYKVLVDMNSGWCRVCPNANLPSVMGGYEEDTDFFSTYVYGHAKDGLLNFNCGYCGTFPSRIAAVISMLKGEDFLRQAKLCRRYGVAADADFPPENITFGCNGRTIAISPPEHDSCGTGLEKADILVFKSASDLVDGQSATGMLRRRCLTAPRVARMPFMTDSSKRPVIENRLKCVQGKSIGKSILLKIGEEEFLRHSKLCGRYGAAVVVMEFDEPGQTVTCKDKMRICQPGDNPMRQKIDSPPEDIIFDCNVLAIAIGLPEHNSCGTGLRKADIPYFNFGSDLIDGQSAMGIFIRLCVTKPSVAGSPFRVDLSKWPVLEEGLKCVQDKRIVNSIPLKVSEKEFLRQAKLGRLCGAAVVVMAFDDPCQAATFDVEVSTCHFCYGLMHQKTAFPPDGIILDCNLLTVAAGLRLCVTDPNGARSPFRMDLLKWSVVEEVLKCVQGKSLVKSILLKVGEKEFLRQVTLGGLYGAAVVVMASKGPGQAETFDVKVRTCHSGYGLMRQKTTFPPEGILLDCNVLTVAAGLRLCVTEPNGSRLPFEIDSSKWPLSGGGLKGTQGKSPVISISLKVGNEEFLRQAKRGMRYGAASADMALDEPSQAATVEVKVRTCQLGYGPMYQKFDFPPADILLDCNLLSAAAGQGLCVAEPTVAESPLRTDSSKLPVIEESLKRTQGKGLKVSISMKVGDEELLRQSRLRRRYGAAVVAMAKRVPLDVVELLNKRVMKDVMVSGRRKRVAC